MNNLLNFFMFVLCVFAAIVLTAVAVVVLPYVVLILLTSCVAGALCGTVRYRKQLVSVLYSMVYALFSECAVALYGLAIVAGQILRILFTVVMMTLVEMADVVVVLYWVIRQNALPLARIMTWAVLFSGMCVLASPFILLIGIVKAVRYLAQCVAFVLFELVQEVCNGFALAVVIARNAPHAIVVLAWVSLVTLLSVLASPIVLAVALPLGAVKLIGSVADVVSRWLRYRPATRTTVTLAPVQQ
jgi:hypothetical protein